MSTYIITAVHTSHQQWPHHHEHIESVRLSNGSELTRAQVIMSIRAGNSFLTAGTPHGSVYVHRCPHCTSGDYITTHPDSTTANNLLHLPRF